jgi:hypothetical protein
MDRRRPRRPSALARGAARSLRERRRRRAREGFAPRLRFQADAPELLLSPHFDDAALSCWSLLSDERELTVVNVFAGIPPAGSVGVWERTIGARDSAERMRERAAEDARALALASRVASNLPLLDEQYRRAGGLSVGLREMEEALCAHVQAASRVYAPAGIGGHADHALVRDYARALRAQGMPVVLYAELPYCFFHGWPAWVDGGEPSPRRDVDAYWGAFLKEVAELPAPRAAEVVRLDEAAMARKRAAVACYETSLNYGVRHLLGEPSFGGYEVRWPLPVEQAGSAAPQL